MIARLTQKRARQSAVCWHELPVAGLGVTCSNAIGLLRSFVVEGVQNISL